VRASPMMRSIEPPSRSTLEGMASERHLFSMADTS
jgi:hypothetical protein